MTFPALNCLNWTNVGLKFSRPSPAGRLWSRLNWTNVGLKSTSLIPSLGAATGLNWTNVGLKFEPDQEQVLFPTV